MGLRPTHGDESALLRFIDSKRVTRDFRGSVIAFPRGLDRPITGIMSWVPVATSFFLQVGQKPDLIRLNLVVQGKGRVWVDDVQLMRGSLPSS